MKIKANTKTVKLVKSEQINTGEYNVERLECVLSEEYADTINFAVFKYSTLEGEKKVKSKIYEGFADVPSFENADTVKIGVYGFKLENDEVQLRYSPTMIEINLKEGTYEEGLDDNSTEQGTDFERYVAEIEQLISEGEIRGVGIESAVVNSSGHLIITYTDGEVVDAGYVRGEKGEKGDKGDKGDPGSSGTTDYTQLENKPSVNGETLIGSKTSADLKLLTVELLPDEFLQYEGGYLDDMFDDESLPSGIFTCAANEAFTFFTDKYVLDKYHTITDKSIFFFDKKTLNACLIGGDYPFYVVGNTGGNIVTTYDLAELTDDTPTAKSENFVTSAGIKTYVDTAVGDINTALQGLISGGGVV